MDGWIGWMEGWMDGRMDGFIFDGLLSCILL